MRKRVPSPRASVIGEDKYTQTYGVGAFAFAVSSREPLVVQVLFEAYHRRANMWTLVVLIRRTILIALDVLLFSSLTVKYMVRCLSNCSALITSCANRPIHISLSVCLLATR